MMCQMLCFETFRDIMSRAMWHMMTTSPLPLKKDFPGGISFTLPETRRISRRQPCKLRGRKHQRTRKTWLTTKGKRSSFSLGLGFERESFFVRVRVRVTGLYWVIGFFRREELMKDVAGMTLWHGHVWRREGTTPEHRKMYTHCITL